MVPAFTSLSTEKPLRVLIVEDTAADAELLVRELDRCLADFTWERAETASELDAAIGRRPDLALCDIKLPKLDGRHAIAELRARVPGVAIIVITGELDDREAAELMAAGTNDYLLKDRLGRLGGAIEHALHVSRLHASLSATEQDLRLAAKILESLVEGVMILDEQWRLVKWNPAFERLLGLDDGGLRGTVPEFVSPDIRIAVESHGRWQGEIELRRGDGGAFPALVTFSSVPAGDGMAGHYVGVFDDISISRDFEQRLAYLAQHDPLTGLANREHLHESLAAAIGNARRGRYGVGVVAIGLDHFKAVNESLGHKAGDRLLRAVAARLRECVRDEDRVARLSGDEFGVVLAAVDRAEDCTGFVHRMVQALKAPVMLDGHELYVTATTGISVYPGDGTGAAELLGNADVAMYRAKEQGRNTYQFFSNEMNADALDNLLLANALRSALANEEFVLHYQPRYMIDGRRVTGVEALIRWQHPKRGLVPPDRFIPLAESTGMIGAIGEWVLRAACLQGMRWEAAGQVDLCVAVNLSAGQLQDPGFVQQVERVLIETGMPAGRLELELTESMLMRDPDSVAVSLAELRALGVRIAVDDFGTGYSSLSYLKRFTINDLKIDRAFVMGLPDDEDDAAIVTAIIAVARSLGMHTVAEGVETDAQLEFLQRLGCDEAQGFLLSRPLPVGELVLS